MSAPKVAVLGATGHVGRVLVAGLSRAGYRVDAFARSPERLARTLAALPEDAGVRGRELADFGAEPFDAVVNATGIGDPARFGPGAGDLIDVTGRFDVAVASYLREHPGSRAVAISSGAVYDSDFEEPAGPGTPLRAPGPPRAAADVYGAVKAASEARHRAEPDLPIVDLRLFGLFSPWIDLDASFLLAEAMRCLRDGTTLITEAADIERDFAHPDDLTALVACVLDAPPQNRAYDVYSLAPASKEALLAMLSERFGLSYTVQPGSRASASGRKPRYHSSDRSAAELGYAPRFTTLEGVADVTASLVESWKDADR